MQIKIDQSYKRLDKFLFQYFESLPLSLLQRLIRKYILAKLFNNKEACQKLFSDISKDQKNRNGGYTRIIKKGNRFGDFAHTSIIQFVK